MGVSVRKRNSLFISLPFFIVLTIVIMGSFSLFLLKNTVKNRVMERVSEAAVLTLTSLDWSVASLINSNDYETLQRLVENAGASRFMSVLMVCSAGGKVIASANKGETGAWCSSDVVDDVLKGGMLISRRFYTDSTFEASVPVTGPEYNQNSKSGAQAALYIKADRNFAVQLYEEYRDFFLIQYVLVGVLITLCLFYLISHLILRPLKKYKTAVDRISEGDYAADIEIMRMDELGVFADALKTMSKEIENKNLELEKTNKNLSEYLKAIDESVIVIRSTLNGRIIYANKKFYDITGRTEKETLGSSINSLRGGGLSDDDIIEYWDTLLNRFIWREVLEHTAANGKKFYVNATVNPITDTEGEVVEFIDIWYDITEIYELKEEVELHKEHLEELVSERTKELSQSHLELKQLYEESENLNRRLTLTHARMIQQEKLASIGQLAAGVAHELNNPVGFIASNFDVMKRYFEKIKNYLDVTDDIIKSFESICHMDCGADAESVFNKAKMLKKEIKIDFIMEDTSNIFQESDHGFARVTSIIDSLRDFSRVDAEEKCSAYDLNEGIMNTLTVARNEIKHVADVKTNLGEIPVLFCNGGEINQVLLNIIVNAAQSVSESLAEGEKGLIEITTAMESGHAVCVIKDNGKGIQKELLNRVFDPFFTTKEPGRGTGLGLSISYDIIVNKHKGMLTVENDGGAKFTFSLPVVGTAGCLLLQEA